MLTLFVEKLSVFACKWPELIVMKCINTIEQGVNYANNQQMSFTASQWSRTWAICTREANQKTKSIPAGRFHQSQARPVRHIHSETLVKQSEKYPYF